MSGGMMARAEVIFDAIQSIYESLLEPNGWPEVLSAVADACRSQHANLLVHEAASQATDFLATFGMTEEHASLFAAGATNLVPMLQQLPKGKVQRSSDLQTEEEFRRSAFYNEAVKPNGAYFGALTPVIRHRKEYVYFIGCRMQGRADFDSEDVATIQTLAPHLATAVQMRRRLGTADLRAASAFATLDRLDSAVILVDSGLRPVFINGLAEEIIARRDCLVLGKASLSAKIATETEALQRALAQAIAFGSRHATLEAAQRVAATTRLCLTRPHPNAPLVCTVVPVDAAKLAGGCQGVPMAALFMVEPGRTRRIDDRLLTMAFGLTPQEARLAAMLAQGMDLGEIAAALGIGLGTARWYLKRILEKTGTHRQAELVGLILGYLVDRVN